ncbi:hypothetical protein HYH03_007531, partial [Edaphochlamys debaryana]
MAVPDLRKGQSLAPDRVNPGAGSSVNATLFNYAAFDSNHGAGDDHDGDDHDHDDGTNTWAATARMRSRMSVGNMSAVSRTESQTSSIHDVLPTTRAAIMWRTVVGWFPAASEQVRSAPLIVKVQAFFKLSFEQYQSDDTSFEDAAAEIQSMMDPAGLEEAVSGEGRSSSNASLQGPASGPGSQRGAGSGSQATPVWGHASAFRAASRRRESPPTPAAPLSPSSGPGARIGSASARLMEKLNSIRIVQTAAAGAEATKEGLTELSQWLATAFGALGAGSGLAVDVALKPTATNYLRTIFWDPVHPNSMFKVWWDFFMLPIDMWTCLGMPIVVVFVCNLRITTRLGVWEFINDVLAFLDVLMQLRTAIITGDFRVKHTLSSIANHYLARWAILDLAAAVPFLTLINIGSQYDYSSRVLLFRLTRFSKLLRLPRVITKSNVQTYLQVRVFKKRGSLPLMVLLLTVFITMHQFSCIFYFIGVVETSNTLGAPSPPPPPLPPWPPGTRPPPPFPPSPPSAPEIGSDYDSWVEGEGVYNMRPAGRYWDALYFVMYTFLTVGYGDIMIVTNAEK